MMYIKTNSETTSKGTTMNYHELTKLLKQAGWRFCREGKGSHKLWKHPNRKDQIAVPDHGSKEIDPGLLRGIRKKAGV